MTRGERLARRRLRHAFMFDAPLGFLAGIVLVLLLVGAVPHADSTPAVRPAAVSQVGRIYACVSPSGSVALRAYVPPCRGGQVVSWAVVGYRGP